VISFIEICPCILAAGEKMPPKVTICALTVTLNFDLLTPKSIEFIFVPKCSELVNLVKLPRAVSKISSYQTFSV